MTLQEAQELINGWKQGISKASVTEAYRIFACQLDIILQAQEIVTRHECAEIVCGFINDSHKYTDLGNAKVGFANTVLKQVQEKILSNQVSGTTIH